MRLVSEKVLFVVANGHDLDHVACQVRVMQDEMLTVLWLQILLAKMGACLVYCLLECPSHYVESSNPGYSSRWMHHSCLPVPSFSQ